MTGKERMMLALRRETPDRMPITIHQWQRYHLREHMGGMDPWEAFASVGLDAAICDWHAAALRPDPHWRVSREPIEADPAAEVMRVQTPRGVLTERTRRGEGTVFVTEHLIKNQNDADMFLEFWPGKTLDRDAVQATYDRTGDAGIVRGHVECAHQPGCWQDFCELVGTQEAILWAVDDPAFVHQFLERLAERKISHVHEQMAGARFDLIEHGGGAGSSSVINPRMFEEFCVAYDRRVIDALHQEGFAVVYHTCGGMMAILDRIAQTGCDASETLSPPGVGGDIATAEDRRKVKKTLGAGVALIGGVDQGLLDTPGAQAEIREQVLACFASYGPGGGYICSASDHFFRAPIENLRALAAAGAECRYG